MNDSQPLRIQLISDVHVEFDADRGRAFVDSLDPRVADVLVMAGDIATEETAEAIAWIAHKYLPKPVLWIKGNHEYYGGSRERVRAWVTKLMSRCPNLEHLERDTTTIRGQRFVGTTLWYPDMGGRDWSDFVAIKDFAKWLGEEATACANFLRTTVRPGDVVITHMLPSYALVNPRWTRSPNNGYFVHEMASVIAQQEPALWLFGHTHDRVDERLGRTRCVCSPRGYPYEGLYTDPNFVVELAPPAEPEAVRAE